MVIIIINIIILRAIIPINGDIILLNFLVGSRNFILSHKIILLKFLRIINKQPHSSRYAPKIAICDEFFIKSIIVAYFFDF